MVQVSSFTRSCLPSWMHSPYMLNFDETREVLSLKDILHLKRTWSNMFIFQILNHRSFSIAEEFLWRLLLFRFSSSSIIWDEGIWMGFKKMSDISIYILTRTVQKFTVAQITYFIGNSNSINIIWFFFFRKIYGSFWSLVLFYQ